MTFIVGAVKLSVSLTLLRFERGASTLSHSARPEAAFAGACKNKGRIYLGPAIKEAYPPCPMMEDRSLLAGPKQMRHSCTLRVDKRNIDVEWKRLLSSRHRVGFNR